MRLKSSFVLLALAGIIHAMGRIPQKPPVAPCPTQPPYQVTAIAKTQDVTTEGDSADDTVVYINKENPEKSLIVGTNKTSGVIVYDLLGNKLQEFADGEPNNIDIRYDFPFLGQNIPLITTANRDVNTIDFYSVDEEGLLKRLFVREHDAGLEVYGSCMYKSPLTSDYYVFVNSKDGDVIQWLVKEDAPGVLTMTNKRHLKLSSQVEGCVADEYYQRFFIGEEKVGIWQFGAEPDDISFPKMIDKTNATGHLVADVEGLSLYRQKDGQGYLLASSQGENAFNLYKRDTLEFVAKFEVDYMAKKIQNTDGIEVSSHALSDLYPYGIIIVQDGNDENSFQSFKMIPWHDLAVKFDPILGLNSYDPILDF